MAVYMDSVYDMFRLIKKRLIYLGKDPEDYEFHFKLLENGDEEYTYFPKENPDDISRFVMGTLGPQKSVDTHPKP